MVDRFANEAGTTLDGAVDDEQTSIAVNDAGLFPDVPFRVRVEDEFLRVTEMDGDTLTVERGIEGSIAAAHDSGVEVWHVITAGSLTALRDDLQAHTDIYTIALIPDTQNLSNSGTNIAHFQALADYLVANAESLNLQLIAHLGDVVDAANETQYDRADGPMSDLYDLDIPMIAVIGNHDYTGGNMSGHDNTSDWNDYFGVDRYEDKPWFGGVKDANRSENMYLLPTIGGRQTLVLAVELFPREATMQWADSVIESHPHHDVIVVTHSFLFIDGTRTRDDSTHGPDHYSLSDATPGEDMWQDHLRHWPNLKLVVSAHHLSGNVAQRSDYGEHGNVVWQQFTNWQAVGQGGDGRIVLHTINPATGAGLRRVFNARNDVFDTTTGNEMQLVLDQQRVDIAALEAVLDIDSGDGSGDGNGGGDTGTSALRGTAEIEHPDTDVDVLHGSENTPSPGEIQITQASSLFDASEFWISDLDEDTFKINLDQSPGDGNTAMFHWLYVPALLGDPGVTIEAFTEDGTWDWSAAGEPDTVEVLVVAGGGGGGGYFSGGGGGAGGFVYDAEFAVSGNVSVVVGAGGDGGNDTHNNDPHGLDGGNSSFGALEAIGGGGGGAIPSSPVTTLTPGSSGGSGGGGGGRVSNSGGSGTSGQGHGGGNARTLNSGGTGGGGGGGGAGAAAINVGANNRGTDGGVGVEFPQFAAFGDGGWFAGGGGGGTITSATPGNGGQGGGGNGNAGVNSDGDDATANTGGGGGGAGNDGTDSGFGGDGGSGIVLVRYPTPV